MFGALAVQGVINHRRKTAAERQAADQWRDHEDCGVIVTTERLICSTTTHGQLSFWFGDCNEFHPDLQQWTLTLGFDSTYPVRLTGPAAPREPAQRTRCAGEKWQHPRLAALLYRALDIGPVAPMCGPPHAAKMRDMAATKFAMDVEPTQANLSSAEEAGAAQHTAGGEGLRPGGYMTALMAAIDGADAAPKPPPPRGARRTWRHGNTASQGCKPRSSRTPRC